MSKSVFCLANKKVSIIYLHFVLQNLHNRLAKLAEPIVQEFVGKFSDGLLFLKLFDFLW